MVKEKEYDEAARIFQTTNVQITTEGRRLPGVALGTATLTESFVGGIVAAQQELDTLAKEETKKEKVRKHSFFLFSFLPSILSLPGSASTSTWQRLSPLVCTCVPRSLSRLACTYVMHGFVAITSVYRCIRFVPFPYTVLTFDFSHFRIRSLGFFLSDTHSFNLIIKSFLSRRTSAGFLWCSPGTVSGNGDFSICSRILWPATETKRHKW